MNRADVMGLQLRMREAVDRTPALKNENPDRLTVAVIASMAIKRFYEGFYGQVFKDKLKEGRELRLKDRAAYDAALQRTAPLLSDLASVRRELRLVETITSSDLSYGLGVTRELERDITRPGYSTNLFTLVKRRTVNNLLPIKTTQGVELKDKFLMFRPEGTTHKQTSWVGRGREYSISNLALGVELTVETIMNDLLGEFLDAQEALGETAARTRAWVVLDAIRRDATRIPIATTGSQGPNITNLTAVDAYLGDQTIDGLQYTRTMTDLFVPGQWRHIANTARNTNAINVQGGASDPLSYTAQNNALYQRFDVHVEPILRDAPVTPYPGHQVSDYIAADATVQPVEFAAMNGFQAGPRLLTRIPDIVELDTLGSFAGHLVEMQVTDWCGAVLRDKSGVVIVSTQ
ncbi:phage major capsid protein [Deinococcus rufus]|uniref:Phage major capsid protein n=1 Tax=Deinococcus rufus TaxID=2136097 RepID=A0ABV7ZBM8_9DEIO